MRLDDLLAQVQIREIATAHGASKCGGVWLGGP